MVDARDHRTHLIYGRTNAYWQLSDFPELAQDFQKTFVRRQRPEKSFFVKRTTFGDVKLKDPGEVARKI